MQLSRFAVTSQLVIEKERTVFPRMLVLAFAAVLTGGLLVGGMSGAPAFAAVPHNSTPAAQQRPDPNAPYAVPAPTRNVTPTPSALVAADAMPCTPENLSVQEIAGNVHGTWHSAKLAFRNQGKKACRLSGYPIVAVLDAQGRSVGSVAVEKATAEEVMQEMAETPPAEQTPAGPSSVVLVPHAVAAFQVVWTAGDACPSVARLLLTPPGTSHAFSVAQPIRICGGRLQVTSLQLDRDDD